MVILLGSVNIRYSTVAQSFCGTKSDGLCETRVYRTCMPVVRYTAQSADHSEQMARHLKVFAPNHPHMQVYSAPQPGSSRDAESHWRDWIKQETIRRVIWMLFFYDTLSCLEMGVPPSISFDEVTHVPLPAPDNIWQARSAEDWRFALTTYRAATLEQVMRMHFQLRPGQDTYAAHRESPKDVSALVCHDFGPYGRLVMVISLLRALIQLGQAQVRVEDSTVQIWARSSAIADEQKLNMFELVTRFGVALKRVCSVFLVFVR